MFFSEYYLLIYAYEDYQELLVTAIVDTPPEYDNQVPVTPIITIIIIIIITITTITIILIIIINQVNVGPGFTIQRMGRPN